MIKTIFTKLDVNEDGIISIDDLNNFKGKNIYFLIKLKAAFKKKFKEEINLTGVEKKTLEKDNDL
jgi:hypothetical protein